MVAGLRVQHEDKVMLVPFFIPVENKTGLMVSQEVFQLIDYIATCKQLQAFHGSKVLRILSDQGTEFVNQILRSMPDSGEYTWQPHPLINRKAMVFAERLVGLAKQCTRRLLLAAGLLDLYWSYAMRFAAEMLRHESTRFSMARTRLWRRRVDRHRH